jgi:hypothetical protein
MAKLSAHGKELLRIELERDITDPESSTTWRRVTRAHMSDGKVMEKIDVRFKPDQYRPNGERYSYGWKLYAKRKTGTTIESYREYVAKLAVALAGGTLISGKPTTWKVVTDGTPVVHISQARIMRAIESGESVGFCKECGHGQDGCEPDARNYKCESCGAMEVYGAEEMLISGC